jgi:carbon starvation protein CstA
MASDTPPVSGDVFLATMRNTPGAARTSLWTIAVIVTAGFGGSVCHFMVGTPRMIFGILTAMLLADLVAWAIRHRSYHKRLSSLVTQALATSRKLSAKRTGASFHEVWLEQGHTIRVTEWMIGVLRKVPGLELHEEK